jgi:hypothetical protein
MAAAPEIAVMDELGIAEAMAAGDLASPQRYMNVWLFAIRITGTGVSYRRQLDEHVYRLPDNYLNERFLKRCNSLEVIWLHPTKTATLTSAEFGNRVIGSIFLRYIREDEVWGIAKIYDDDCAEAMREQQLSTSPTVVFRESDSTQLEAEDGSTLLIEGKPILLDHVAICPLGVWDKGGAPAGISRGDEAMTDDEKKREDRAKKFPRRDGESDDDYDRRCDAEEREEARDVTLKGIADGMAAMTDALKAIGSLLDQAGDPGDPAAAADPVQAAVDRARKRADADASEKRLRADAATAQARADPVYTAFNERAPMRLSGEDLLGYRRRLVSPFVKYSTLKDVDIDVLPAGQAFDHICEPVFSDAVKWSQSAEAVPANTLREIKVRDDAGHTHITFQGRPNAWMDAFAGPVRQHVKAGILPGELLQNNN